MGQEAVLDLIDQYQRSFRMLREEINRFDGGQWVSGADLVQSPVKLCMHIYDCLDFFFDGKMIAEASGGQYQWGHYFGGGWWEFSVDRLPSKDIVLVYAGELERRVVNLLSVLQDEDLSCPCPQYECRTWLGHYIYGLRHTIHHGGELAALAVAFGLPGGSWE